MCQTLENSQKVFFWLFSGLFSFSTFFESMMMTMMIWYNKSTSEDFSATKRNFSWKLMWKRNPFVLIYYIEIRSPVFIQTTTRQSKAEPESDEWKQNLIKLLISFFTSGSGHSKPSQTIVDGVNSHYEFQWILHKRWTSAVCVAKLKIEKVSDQLSRWCLHVRWPNLHVTTLIAVTLVAWTNA